jgi:hypothetical protein
LQPQGEVFILNPPPDQLVKVANQPVEEPQMQVPMVHYEPPILPASPVNSSEDEISYDQLLGSQQNSSGDQSQQMEQEIQDGQNIQQLEPEVQDGHNLQ